MSQRTIRHRCGHPMREVQDGEMITRPCRIPVAKEGGKCMYHDGATRRWTPYRKEDFAAQPAIEER